MIGMKYTRTYVRAIELEKCKITVQYRNENREDCMPYSLISIETNVVKNYVKPTRSAAEKDVDHRQHLTSNIANNINHELSSSMLRYEIRLLHNYSLMEPD